MTPCRENCHDDRCGEGEKVLSPLHCGAGTGRVHKTPCPGLEFEVLGMWLRTGPGGGPRSTPRSGGCRSRWPPSRKPSPDGRAQRTMLWGKPRCPGGCWPGGLATGPSGARGRGLKEGWAPVPAGRAYPSGKYSQEPAVTVATAPLCRHCRPHPESW